MELLMKEPSIINDIFTIGIILIFVHYITDTALGFTIQTSIQISLHFLFSRIIPGTIKSIKEILVQALLPKPGNSISPFKPIPLLIKSLFG